MFKLDKKSTVLVVMDMQEKLAELMNEDMLETVVDNVGIMTKSASFMGIPIIETFQDSKGLGGRMVDLEGLPKAALTIEKKKFSACGDENFMKFLKDKNIKSVILVGMEAHIGILQTALDLLEAGFSVHISADAVISANDFSWETGLDMTQSAGAVITVTETAVYQLLGTSEAEEFKNVHKLLK